MKGFLLRTVLIFQLPIIRKTKHIHKITTKFFFNSQVHLPLHCTFICCSFNNKPRQNAVLKLSVKKTPVKITVCISRCCFLRLLCCATNPSTAQVNGKIIFLFSGLGPRRKSWITQMCRSVYSPFQMSTHTGQGKNKLFS